MDAAVPGHHPDKPEPTALLQWDAQEDTQFPAVLKEDKMICP